MGYIAEALGGTTGAAPSLMLQPTDYRDPGPSGLFGFIGNVLGGVGDIAQSLGTLTGQILQDARDVVVEGVTLGHAETNGFQTPRFLAALPGAFVQDFRERYGPLSRGDFSEFGNQLYAHPVSFIADALAVAGGAGAIAKGAEGVGLAGKVAGALGVDTAGIAGGTAAIRTLRAAEAAGAAGDATRFGEVMKAGNIQSLAELQTKVAGLGPGVRAVERLTAEPIAFGSPLTGKVERVAGSHNPLVRKVFTNTIERKLLSEDIATYESRLGQAKAMVETGLAGPGAQTEITAMERTLAAMREGGATQVYKPIYANFKLKRAVDTLVGRHVGDFLTQREMDVKSLMESFRGVPKEQMEHVADLIQGFDAGSLTKYPMEDLTTQVIGKGFPDLASAAREALYGTEGAARLSWDEQAGLANLVRDGSIPLEETYKYIEPDHLQGIPEREAFKAGLNDATGRMGMPEPQRDFGLMWWDTLAQGLHARNPEKFPTLGSVYSSVGFDYAEKASAEVAQGLAQRASRVYGGAVDASGKLNFKRVAKFLGDHSGKDWYTRHTEFVSELTAGLRTKINGKPVKDFELLNDLIAATSPAALPKAQFVGKAGEAGAIRIYEMLKKGELNLVPGSEGPIKWGPGGKVLRIEDPLTGKSLIAAQYPGTNAMMVGEILQGHGIAQWEEEIARNGALSGRELKELKKLYDRNPLNLSQREKVRVFASNLKGGVERGTMDRRMALWFGIFSDAGKGGVWEKAFGPLKEMWPEGIPRDIKHGDFVQMEEWTKQVQAHLNESLSPEEALSLPETQAMMWTKTREFVRDEIKQLKKRIKKLPDGPEKTRAEKTLRLFELSDTDKLEDATSYTDAWNDLPTDARARIIKNIGSKMSPTTLANEIAGEIKGATVFGPDFGAMVHFFKTGDFTTLVHESGHVLRRFLPEEDQLVLTRTYSELAQKTGKRKGAVDILASISGDEPPWTPIRDVEAKEWGVYDNEGSFHTFKTKKTAEDWITENKTDVVVENINDIPNDERFWSDKHVETFLMPKAGEAKAIKDLGDGISEVSSEGTPFGADRLFVARDEAGKPIGVMGYYEKGGGSVSVAVDPGSRRQGIATKLYQKAEAEGVPVRDVSGKTVSAQGEALSKSFLASEAPAVEGAPIKDWYDWQNTEVESIPKDMENREIGYATEASMDIGRELALKGREAAADLGYVREKIDRVRRVLKDNKLGTLDGADADLGEELVSKLDSYEGPTSPTLDRVRELTKAITAGDVPEARRLLDEVEKDIMGEPPGVTRYAKGEKAPPTKYTPPENVPESTYNGPEAAQKLSENLHGVRWSAQGIIDGVKERGGLSVKILTGDEPPSGFMVARPSKQYGRVEKAVDFFDPVKGKQILADYLKEHRAELAGDEYLGLWHDKANGEIALDVVQNVADEAEARKLGLQHNQQTIWDVTNEREISTGGTGDRATLAPEDAQAAQGVQGDVGPADRGLGGAGSPAAPGGTQALDIEANIQALQEMGVELSDAQLADMRAGKDVGGGTTPGSEVATGPVGEAPPGPPPTTPPEAPVPAWDRPWSRAMEEAFAEDLEKWFYNGIKPRNSETVLPIFETFRTQLAQMWHKVRGFVGDKQLVPEESAKIFDEVLGSAIDELHPEITQPWSRSGIMRRTRSVPVANLAETVGASKDVQQLAASVDELWNQANKGRLEMRSRLADIFGFKGVVTRATKDRAAVQLAMDAGEQVTDIMANRVILSSWKEVDAAIQKIQEAGLSVVGADDTRGIAGPGGHRGLTLQVADETGFVSEIEMGTPRFNAIRESTHGQEKLLRRIQEDETKLAQEMGSLELSKGKPGVNIEGIDKILAEHKEILDALRKQKEAGNRYMEGIWEQGVDEIDAQVNGSMIPNSAEREALNNARLWVARTLEAPELAAKFDFQYMFERQYLPQRLERGARWDPEVNDFVGTDPSKDINPYHLDEERALQGLPQPFYFPQQKVPKLSDFLIPRGAIGMRKFAKSYHMARDTGANFLAEEYVRDPIKAYSHRAARALKMRDTYELVSQVAKEYGRRVSPGEPLSESEALFAPDGLLRFFSTKIGVEDTMADLMMRMARDGRVPEEMMAMSRRHAMDITPDLIAEGMKAVTNPDMEAAALLTAVESTIEAARRHIIGVTKNGLELYAVPKTVVKRLEASVLPKFGTKVRMFWDTPTNLWRSLVLAGSPRWTANNALGNIFLAKLSGTRLWDVARQVWDKEYRDWLDELTAQSPGSTVGFMDTVSQYNPRLGEAGDVIPEALREKAELLAQSAGVGVIGKGVRGVRKVGNFNRMLNSAIEDHFRRAAFLKGVERELVRRDVIPVAKSFFSSKKRLEEILNNGLDQATLDSALTFTNKAFGDYRHLGPTERQVIRRFLFPFYGFYKHVVKTMINAPIDHPLKFAVMRSMAEVSNDMEAEYGPIPSWLEGMVPFGPINEDGSTRFLSTSGPNPLNIFNQSALSMLHPFLKSVVEFSTGRSTFTGRQFTDPDVITPFGTDQQYRIIRDESGQPIDAIPVEKVVPSPLQLLLSNVPQYSMLKDLVGGGRGYDTQGILATAAGGPKLTPQGEVARPVGGLELAGKFMGLSTFPFDLASYQANLASQKSAALKQALELWGASR